MPGTAVKFREKTDFVDSVICDDALSGMSLIPSGIVDSIVTSPPYYGQRDYSHPNQIGNEATPEAYREKGRFTPPGQPKDRSARGEKAWAYPVVAGGRLYIRDVGTLWCYDVRAAR